MQAIDLDNQQVDLGQGQMPSTWPGARPTALRTGARSPISRCHPPAMIGRSPLGSRTALLSLRVDTLILVRPTKLTLTHFDFVMKY
jgi:hypothetical protein